MTVTVTTVTTISYLNCYITVFVICLTQLYQKVTLAMCVIVRVLKMDHKEKG